MFEKLQGLLDIEAIFGLLAASGGIARIIAGTSKDPSISVWAEAARVLFIALPLGIIVGLWVQDSYSSRVLPLAASFTAGVVSLNVVRFMLSSEGLSLFKTLLGGILKNGQK
jgi:hypothetical protein